MTVLSGSVGQGGLNRRQDVLAVQTLINKKIEALGPGSAIRAVPVSGTVDAGTIAAIEALQRRFLGMPNPDGRVDPNGRTLKMLDSPAAPAVDPAIEALDLSVVAKKAAYALKAAHPEIVFTSGRRDKADQARAMASNVVSNRKWIEQTYLDTPACRACQKWVDDNPSAATKEQIATGLLGVLNGLTDAEVGRLSRHLSGDAFDVQPVIQNADAIKADIRKLPGLERFLDREGGLVRWHAQF